jgi:hypothetical protein
MRRQSLTIIKEVKVTVRRKCSNATAVIYMTLFYRRTCELYCMYNYCMRIYEMSNSPFDAGPISKNYSIFFSRRYSVYMAGTYSC